MGDPMPECYSECRNKELAFLFKGKPVCDGAGKTFWWVDSSLSARPFPNWDTFVSYNVSPADTFRISSLDLEKGIGIGKELLPCTNCRK